MIVSFVFTIDYVDFEKYVIKYGFNKSIICFLVLLRQMASAGLEQKYFRHNNSPPAAAAQNKKGLKGILNTLKYFHILAFNFIKWLG